MRRRNVGYFNQAEFDPIPSQIGAAPRPAASPLAKKSAKRLKGFRNELISTKQIIGGMLGFVGTETFTDILSNYVPYNPLIVRAISGALVYGGTWIFASYRPGAAGAKSELKKAVLLGIAINIAVSLLTSGAQTLKSAVGLGAYDYDRTAPTPTNMEVHNDEYQYQ